ncbi:HAD family hydrolase [Shinella sp.]|uniref:HAD family hydrolase n=1 Tax=Shinella sp. TaxID=1870904 RepID=UPI0029B77B04|nr:HAD family hydrolase [Shinella sp.]MDX3973516.1 HAD family hydrolase [Shinella sp.]
MPSIDLVIFDCDGVLVDSERATSDAIAFSLTRFGHDIDGAGVLARYLGRTLPQIEADARARGYELPEGWCGICETEMFDRLSREATVETDTLRLISSLGRRDVQVGIASNGANAKMKLTLGPSGIWHRFRSMILSGQDTGYPKPSPVMLQTLMERVGVRPQNTVMIDDSELGRRAADAAGCHFIGYRQFDPGGDTFDDCAFVARSMADVETILEEIGGACLQPPTDVESAFSI